MECVAASLTASRNRDEFLNGMQASFCQLFISHWHGHGQGTMGVPEQQPSSPSLFDMANSMSLFETASSMTVGCIAVFLLAELRKLAKKGVLMVDAVAGVDDNELMLQLPFKAGNSIPSIWRRNKVILRRKMRSDQYNTLGHLADSIAEQQERYPLMARSQCEHVGDEKASNECVYSIHTNEARKRIVLVFRGSITLKDWFQDTKSAFGEVKNPLYGVDLSSSKEKHPDGIGEEQPEMLPIHMGFKEYLYGSKYPLSVPFREISSHLPNLPDIQLPFAKSGGDCANDENEKDKSDHIKTESDGDIYEQSTKSTKIETILDQISAIYNAKPDYELSITGHSLGGALALITSLEAAVRFSVQERKAPVTCITIGNPMAGGHTFRQAVHSLEQQGHLRVLGVHRMDDLVPLLPGTLCTCSVMNRFCHVGIQLKLKRGDRYTVRYLGKGDEDSLQKDVLEKWRHARLILPCMHRIKERHFYRTYLDDLQTRKASLGAVTLDELYAKALRGDRLE